MAKSLMSLLFVAVGLIVLLLAVAWFDGGRVEPRMIEETVELPGADA